MGKIEKIEKVGKVGKVGKLGKLNKQIQFLMALIVSVSILTSNWAFAANTSDEQSWQKLVQKIVKEGEVLNSEYGTYLIMSEITPNKPDLDQDGNHINNYISLVGGFSPPSSSNFFLSHVEAVWENWQLDADGNWKVDQWLFKLTENGDLLSARHYSLVETKQRRVLKHQYEKEKPEIGETIWMLLKKSWLQKVANE
ncbi:MAG: hypothetical protein H6625_13470 [Bdellovibrionaceae bacterium]|nr:hypothetical protein [Pseudobdellovibrionaceae bacterium]